MGRQVRMVPADWVHPLNDDGKPIPLLKGSFAKADAEWNEGWAKWQDGLCENYGDGEKWGPIEADDLHMRYTDYAGSRPSPDEYMPNWPAEQRTHLMMYEDTSEGTPISPAFETPEELARWLTDNNASAFGRQTASYEAWLATVKRGWTVSAVMTGGEFITGDEFEGRVAPEPD